MKAKFSSICKVTGLQIVAGETEIDKVNGVWQVISGGVAIAPQPAAAPSPAVVSATIPNGYYTVVFGSSHLTLRVKSVPAEWDSHKGSQIVGVLTGPDNGSSYTNFGFLTGGKVKPWNKFLSGYENWKAAFDVLLGSSADEVKGFGEAYALESGNCYRCGRLLTDPTSISLGIGPLCRTLN